MNRLVSTVALQSIAAAALITLAPLANAASGYAAFDAQSFGQPTSSLADRTQVRQGALDAAREARPYATFDSQAETPAVSSLSRAQVRAEAVEAVRLGLVGDYENDARPNAAQLAQIERAGQRADGGPIAALR